MEKDLQDSPAEDRLAQLAPRLREVLGCLLEGASEKQVARQLGISPHTVNHHVQRLYRQFGVRSRGELFWYCQRNGYLLAPPSTSD